MKRIAIILLVAAVIPFHSCHKILDTKPTDFVSPSLYFNNADLLEKSLVGIYDALALTYSTNWLYRYGMDADEGYYRSKVLTGLHTYAFNASEAQLQTVYNYPYVAITRANMLLSVVDQNTKIDEKVRNKAKGEALFLRAHCYFMLVQMFGEVPLILENAVSPQDVHVPKSSIKQIYEQIYKDMVTAEGLVSDIQTLGFGGRVNKSAVRGMLARVSLHMAGTQLNDATKYQEAKNWAQKIIQEGYHTLNPSFSDIFIKYASDKYDTKESLWELEFWGNRTGGYVETTQNGAVNGPAVPAANTATGVAVGGLFATKNLYELYAPGDIRRDWAIANFTYSTTNTNGAKNFVSPTTQIYSRAAAKARREYEVVTPKAAQWTPQNYPMMRYSDVLLMFAEASNEINGPTQEAIDAINLVRRRGFAIGGIKSFNITNAGVGYTSAPTVTIGGATGLATATIVTSTKRLDKIILTNNDVTGVSLGNYTTPPTITLSGGGATTQATVTATLYTAADADISLAQYPTKEALRKLIQDERSRELCFEGLRKFDLIRWGIFVPRMNEVGNYFVANCTPAADGQFYGQHYLNVAPKHVVFPIPDLELIRNNKLTQTPGWE